MNKYRYEDIQIGHCEEFDVTVNLDMFDAVKNITGDTNPLHCDEEFAKSKGYKSRVAYGMLTSLFYSTLCGVYLPGERSLIHSIECKFNKPVFAGDILKIHGSVDKKFDKFKMIRISAKIYRMPTQEVVSTAVINVGVTE